ncbi:MAG: permease-like cell division protein FtsX [Actinomycetota bacterium]
MAISPVYALRETGQNLWRNFLLSLATVITIGVSLCLFGGFFLFNYAVDNATQRWEGGIEFVVWMNPEATAEQNANILDAITTSPEIRDFTFVDQNAAYEEFQEIFSDTPELIEVVTPEAMPPSYRVVPVDPDADVVEELANQFTGRPGVKTVVSANDTIRDIQDLADDVGRVFLFGSIVLLAAATLLILTNIVSAIRNRGREIEIMKVVGATNWFIRIPFMLEGVVQALIGAVLAWGGLVAIDRQVIQQFSQPDSLELMAGFRVESDEFVFTSGLVLGIAILVSVIGSSIAVTRYLDA